jgi:hypothetical protein
VCLEVEDLILELGQRLGSWVTKTNKVVPANVHERLVWITRGTGMAAWTHFIASIMGGGPVDERTKPFSCENHRAKTSLRTTQQDLALLHLGTTFRHEFFDHVRSDETGTTGPVFGNLVQNVLLSGGKSIPDQMFGSHKGPECTHIDLESSLRFLLESLQFIV